MLSDSKGSSVIISSFQLVFSSLQSSPHTLKMVIAPQEEVSLVHSVKALLVPCMLYSAALQDETRPVRQDLKPTVKLLMQVTSLQQPGSNISTKNAFGNKSALLRNHKQEQHSNRNTCAFLVYMNARFYDAFILTFTSRTSL
jgi:hypothetical protein